MLAIVPVGGCGGGVARMAADSAGLAALHVAAAAAAAAAKGELLARSIYLFAAAACLSLLQAERQ